MNKTWLRVVLVAALSFVGTKVASADTFNFTSCHISGSTCAGGSIAAPGFGSVTLTQSGTSVLIDVVLINGNGFVETGAGGGFLFLFNDTIAGSFITSITTTVNGTVTAVIPGGVTGATNQPAIMADGTGTFTAGVECTVASDCNGGSTPFFNDLHFTVTNATVAGLETANANGNLFVADVLCGSAQTQCGGLTGPVDVSTPSTTTPEPGTLLLFGSGLLGVAGLIRRRFSLQQ